MTSADAHDADADAEIEALALAFENLTLPRAEWTHQAHLKVALRYLRRDPRPEAADRMRSGIKAYVAHHGNEAGYHETITLAWVAVISRFLDEHDHGQPLAELTDALLASCGARDHLRSYYSEGLLMSDEARRAWVPPDLRPIEDDRPAARLPEPVG